MRGGQHGLQVQQQQELPVGSRGLREVGVLVDTPALLTRIWNGPVGLHRGLHTRQVGHVQRHGRHRWPSAARAGAASASGR
jgi:hypothetical protein